MLLCNAFSGDLFGLVVVLLIIFVTYFKWSFQYWQRKNVPYLEPQIPFGNLTKAMTGKEHVGLTLKTIYDEMKNNGWQHGGIYNWSKAIYFPINLDYIRNIMTRDFEYFTDRDGYFNEKDPLQAHLLNLTGTRWRNMRSKLTPTFTSGKMKMMFQIMADCQDSLLNRMQKECLKKEPINIKEILAAFTTNIIGSCAFGLDCEALENEDSPFRVFGRKIFETTKLQRFKRIFATTFPQLAKIMRLSVARKENAKFIMKLVEDTINYREKNNYIRNDFMQLLINLKNKPKDSDDQPLTMDEIASQSIVFFAAGFETSSTLMTFALYELAKHQEIQEKLRREINDVLAKHNNEVTYDSVQNIKYLNQVIDETLRLHSPAALVNRKCVKDYKIPDQDIIIEKGTTVFISILGIHHDKEYYPNPETFDPERFSDENKIARHNYSHIPFGEGPRNCIGMRFGLLQSKVGLICLVKNYEFTVSRKTIEPLRYQPSHVVLSAEGGIWLNAEKISS